MRLNGLDLLGFVLTIIGGLNWGLIGIFNFNLVDFLFGAGSLLSRIVYVLVAEHGRGVPSFNSTR